MTTIYRLTPSGWIKVRKCASFSQACKLEAEMQRKTGIEHCVNT